MGLLYLVTAKLTRGYPQVHVHYRGGGVRTFILILLSVRTILSAFQLMY
jgi:hypothetical protein